MASINGFIMDYYYEGNENKFFLNRLIRRGWS